MKLNPTVEIQKLTHFAKKDNKSQTCKNLIHEANKQMA